MKKVLSVLMVAVALMMAAPAQAQLIKFGVKGGMNFSKISLSNSPWDGSDQTGWFIGPMAELTLPIVGLGVDIAALYSQTEVAVDNDYSGSDAKLKTLEIPINLKWSFGLGSMLGAYLAAGPQFGYNIGAKNLTDWNLEKSSTSLNVGVGLKLLKHLQVGLNYNIALSNAGTYDYSSYLNGLPHLDNAKAEAKNNTWQVSAAYIF